MPFKKEHMKVHTINVAVGSPVNVYFGGEPSLDPAIYLAIYLLRGTEIACEGIFEKGMSMRVPLDVWSKPTQ